MESDERRGRIIEVILNSGSGTLDKQTLAGNIESFLSKQGLLPRVHIAATGSDLVRLAQQAGDGDADIVVAGGGDGTIATVAGHMVDTGKTFGVLPLGTFNYFAKNLGIPLDLDEALDVLAHGASTSIDVGDVNGHLFVNNSSIGLYPTVLVKRESTYRKFGRSQLAAYLSVLQVLIQPPRFLNLTVSADGHLLARRTPLLFIGHNAFQMESFGIIAQECVTGRALTLYVTRPLGALGLLRLAARAFVRGLRGAREFESICASEIVVGMRRARVRVAMDGEVRTLDTPLRYRIRRDALRVAVPAVQAAQPQVEPELTTVVTSDSPTEPDRTASR